MRFEQEIITNKELILGLTSIPNFFLYNFFTFDQLCCAFLTSGITFNYRKRK